MTSDLTRLVPDAVQETRDSALLLRVDDAFSGTEIPRLVRECLARTLTDTLTVRDDGSIFVLTGDIPAMWLRDSSTQFWPYLLLAAERPQGAVADVIAGVIRQQFRFIRHDPYANAFNIEPNARAHDPNDLHPDPMVWERKYEIDSLCLPVQFAHRFWRLTGRDDVLGPDAEEAFTLVVETLSRERRHEQQSSYRFVREGANALDTLARDGLGSEVAENGMTWSGFRPSDDACVYGYNTAANLLAATSLRQLAELTSDSALAERARILADDVEEATLRHAQVDTEEFGTVLAYELDGRGNHLLMDDANLPSLLGLPLVTSLRLDDPLYLRTRAMVLSESNPYYYRGADAAGIGSPHTWPDYVWPIALAVEGLTDPDRDNQRAMCLLLTRTTGGTDRFHESFDVNDPTRFTRPWFSWADSMFALLAFESAGEGLSAALRAVDSA